MEKPQKKNNQKLLLEEITETVTIPASAQQVILLAQSPHASIAEIAGAVAKDPSLSVELLRIANSPVYGQSRNVDDIPRAVLVIGLQELRDMAAAIAMLSAFHCKDELFDSIHGASLLSGTIARKMTEAATGESPSTGFLCGLLCEIGALACISVDPTDYKDLWKAARGDPMGRASLEAISYGVSSEKIGGRMLARNQLPESLVEAVGASVADDPAELTPLAKVTVFSRLATSILTDDAFDEFEVDDLKEKLFSLSSSLFEKEMDGGKLLSLCEEAVVTANLCHKGDTPVYCEN